MVLFMTNAIIEKLEALTAGEIRGKQDLFIFLYGEKASEKLNIKSIEDWQRRDDLFFEELRKRDEQQEKSKF